MKITGKDFVAFDFNAYEPVFKCECGYEEIHWNYKFCPMCGTALSFDSEIIFNKEQAEKIPDDFMEIHEVKL